MNYPKWYYYRRGDSDRDWIFNMLHFIPEEFHKKVSERYERIYRRKGRKPANKFLHRIAKHHKNKRL